MLRLETVLSLSRVPYITYDMLDLYAEAVIDDAAPDVLDAPAPVNVEQFLEFYLGLNIEYKALSYDHKILGLTVFNDCVVFVVDEISRRQVPLGVSEGTVFIDPILLQKRSTARRRFTAMHEGAHWLIHREAFSADNPFGTPGVFDNKFLAAKTGRIDYSRCQTHRNDSERIERQADFLAAAMLMPKATLRMAFREFFHDCGEKPRTLVRGRSTADDCLADALPEYIAEQFRVSKRAALIRLEKLNAITGRPASCCLY
jgi:hypothetical protein